MLLVKGSRNVSRGDIVGSYTKPLGPEEHGFLVSKQLLDIKRGELA